MDYEARMIRLLRTLTDDYQVLFVNENDKWCCPFCREESTYRIDFIHRMYCPVIQGRRLLEEVEPL